MQGQDKLPHTRKERLQRTLRINTMLGIGYSSCHDIEVAYPPINLETEAPLDEGYIVSVDLETGELTTRPHASE